ncbi:MAG: oxaloacetate decarboxylase subunit alpha [Clostridia bacterium]|nr:oxaloacetate decarboxylase subunit alpha [Clostridia bacterium]
MTNNNPVKITETVLRDAHQSLIATRMPIEDILPSLSLLDAVGYHALEVWGGATFDACLRFLNEDPWERLRKIRNGAKNTKLQMLFRGQNILGYRHYSDDVVEYFVQKSLANGIDIIRIFDALNDPRNLDTAVNATIKEGGHVQAAFSYTISPVHNTQTFVDFAKNMEERGANSICIKDMAGLLTPYNAFELVSALKESVKIPIELHTHCTAGIAEMTVLKSVEAGVDIIDTAISPLSGGTSQPSTESIVATLNESERSTGLDLDKLNAVRKYFMSLREKYLSTGLLNTKVLAVDVNTLLYQVPGGMLSNLVSQLKQAGKEDKFEEVLREVPRVREDAGFPPLVTPSSQIVGTQAVFNVLFGRYKNVSKEFKALVRGEYGKTPVPIKPEFVKQIIGDESQITCRPADLIPPELDKLREEMKEYYEQEEDVLSYALFDQVATKFFKARQSSKYGVDNSHSDKNDMVHPV